MAYVRCSVHGVVSTCEVDLRRHEADKIIVRYSVSPQQCYDSFWIRLSG